tara:strand:- start:184 stop:423 length:240 start_codon:yes stop_codon:yes gene_type:complete
MNVQPDKIKNRIAEVLNISKDKFNDDTTLKDLVSDSFLLVEMAIELQEDFEVRLTQEDLKMIVTIGDLISLINDKKSRD